MRRRTGEKTVVDKNSGAPLYRQIADILKNEIIHKKYGNHGCIGTHDEIARRFGVSMITVRKTMKLLAEEDYVDVIQGKGTFVKQSILQDNLSRLVGASNIIAAHGYPVSAKMLDFEFRETPQILNLAEEMGPQCLHFKRLHYISGAPAAFSEIYLPYRYGVQLTWEELEQNTVYQLYQDKLGVELGKGRQIISADRASQHVAQALEIKLNWPVLSIMRRAYSASGELIEFMRMYYEYSQYSFEVELDLGTQ